MKLTQDNVETTIADLYDMVSYFEHHEKFIDDYASARTLLDAIEELEALKYFAD